MAQLPDKTPIRELGFGTRPLKALGAARIFSIKDARTRTYQELLDVPGLGVQEAKKLRRFLKDNKTPLKGDTFLDGV
ncbi:MAG TPA: hypothetical protein VGB97_00635 [Candidatus Paceibacterota bacterium]|jgi:DNA-directed RNA polymerase alpha subunit